MTSFVQPNYNTDTGTAYPLGIDQSIAFFIENHRPKSIAPNPFFQVDQLANSATSIADDTYGHDHWYVLTETASVQVSTLTLVENGQATMARLTQNQAGAQRMGYACIIEAKEAQKYRGQETTFRPRIRNSSGQAVRCAVLEWTGTADSVTSDVVNSWTNATYTAGQFFVSTTTNVLGVGAKTPAAATLTDMDALTVTVGNSCNNLILFVWTEGTAAQNVTLDIGKVRFVQGNYTPSDIYLPTFDETLRYALRFFEKTFPYATAPAQNAGVAGAITISQAVAANTAMVGSYRYTVKKRGSAVPTFYNPSATNAQVRNAITATDCTATSGSNNSENGTDFTFTSPGGSAAGNILYLHAVGELRL